MIKSRHTSEKMSTEMNAARGESSAITCTVYAVLSEEWYGGAGSKRCKACGIQFKPRAFKTLEAAEKFIEEYGAKVNSCPDGESCRVNLDLDITPMTVE